MHNDTQNNHFQSQVNQFTQPTNQHAIQSQANAHKYPCTLGGSVSIIFFHVLLIFYALNTRKSTKRPAKQDWWKRLNLLCVYIQHSHELSTINFRSNQMRNFKRFLELRRFIRLTFIAICHTITICMFVCVLRQYVAFNFLAFQFFFLSHFALK